MNRTLLICIFLIFCSVIADGQSFEIYKGDTINVINAENKKTGKWIFFFPGTEQIFQTGCFENGKKDGVWQFYYSGGKIKSELTYKSGLKSGYAKVYFENGNIAEEGTWKQDKWVGKYKSYYKNGKLSYAWNYNEKGNRCGYQQYFYKNGKIKIEGEWKDGKESGIIKEYYESGAIKSKKNFSEGRVKDEDITLFNEGQKEIKTDEAVKNDSLKLMKNNDSVKVFTGNGYYLFYNKFKQVEKEGYFENGVMINGKHFIYNEEGKLLKTCIYQKSKIIEVKEE